MKIDKVQLVENMKKINNLLLMLMIFSMVTMRGVMNITSVVLLLSSIVLYFLEGRKKIFKDKIWILLILSYPLAVVLNFLSPAGMDGAFNTFSRFYYVLVIFVYAVNNIEYKYKDKLLLCFEVAMIIGCLWSLYLYNNPEQLDIHYPGNHNGALRLRSFESVGRWGIYLMMGIIIKYSQLFVEKNKIIQLYNVSYFGLLSYVLLLNSGRGPWLFTIVGLLIFIIFSFDKKVIVVSSILALLFFTTFKYNDKMHNYVMRFVSIADTVSNRSNTIRLETWKVGFDIANENSIFGIGYQKNQNYILEYREKMKTYKGQEYIDKYLYYSWVVEGAYVALLAQNGYIYVLFYLGIIFSLFFKIISKIFVQNRNKKIEMIGLISAVISYFILQQFYLDLQSYSIYLVYLFFYFILTDDLYENGGDKSEHMV